MADILLSRFSACTRARGAILRRSFSLFVIATQRFYECLFRANEEVSAPSIIREIVLEVMAKKTNERARGRRGERERDSVEARTRYEAGLVSTIFAIPPFPLPSSAGNAVASEVSVYVSCQFILISQSHLCPAMKRYLYAQERRAENERNSATVIITH